jgi:hypothetical protein
MSMETLPPYGLLVEMKRLHDEEPTICHYIKLKKYAMPIWSTYVVTLCFEIMSTCFALRESTETRRINDKMEEVDPSANCAQRALEASRASNA